MLAKHAFKIIGIFTSGLNRDRFKEIFGEEKGEILHKTFIQRDFDPIQFYYNCLQPGEQKALEQWLDKQFQNYLYHLSKL